MSGGEDKMHQYCQENVSNGDISTIYIHWFLIPAVGIILLFSFIEKRKSIKPDVLGGRPALVRPLGFLDEPRNRWGIMFVFGSITGIILQATLRTILYQLNWPIWTKIFLVYILCLETSVICYPLFACMTSRHKLAGAIAGLLYSIGWFIFELFKIVQIGRCYVKYVKNAQVNFLVFSLIVEMPILICDLLVVLKFSLKLFKCLRKGIYKINNQDQVKLCRGFHMTYVKHLLNRQHELDIENNKLSWKQAIQQKITQPVPGFRFPISIMITSFMSAIMLYIIGLTCTELIVAIVINAQARKYIIEFVDLLQAANVIATIVTMICGIRNIYLFMMSYKRDMLLLFKGDRSFIPNNVQTASPNKYMAQGMRFIGTSITGMFWGTLLCFLFVFIPLALMMWVIKVLSKEGKLHEIWAEFQWLIYPVCMIIIFKVQVFLIGRFFIQPKLHPADKFRPLAVDNRNAYDVFSFFMVFLNASIGLFSFLKRILVSAFLGVFLISRMDLSLLLKGYETMDRCYVNYIGMIMVDVAHNHPVMRAFCGLVKSEVENRQDRKPIQSAVENAEYGDLSFSQHIPEEIRNSMAKRRWWLAFTLIRNPSLAAMRVRGTKSESLQRRSEVDVADISWSDKTAVLDKDQSADTWGFSIRCCKNYKLKIPPNIIINIMALIVLLSLLVVYSGLPLLIKY